MNYVYSVQKPKIDDPEEKEFELKVCKAINRMPEEVKDRFKALKVIEVRQIWSNEFLRMKQTLQMKRKMRNIESQN